MENFNKAFSFDLPIVDRAIVEALRLSVEDIMPDIMSDHNLVERNGHGQFRWNIIISQLRDKCHHLGWLDLTTLSILSRRGWKTPVLFHPASRNILTLMTEDTFGSVRKQADKGTHYLCGGAGFNPNVEAQHEQLELVLPGVSPGAEIWVAKSQEELAKAVSTDVGEIEGHILVLFEVRADKLLTVRAVRLTPKLEISTEEEDWSQYIRIPYAADQIAEPQQSSEDDEEELVALL